MKVILAILVGFGLGISAYSARGIPEGGYKAKCTPNRIGAKTDGYTCTNIGAGSNFQKAGLQNGDVVISIDQIKIDTPKTAMTMLEAIEKASCKEIVISRAGKEITLNPTFQ